MQYKKFYQFVEENIKFFVLIGIILLGIIVIADLGQLNVFTSDYYKESFSNLFFPVLLPVFLCILPWLLVIRNIRLSKGILTSTYIWVFLMILFNLRLVTDPTFNSTDNVPGIWFIWIIDFVVLYPLARIIGYYLNKNK